MREHSISLLEHLPLLFGGGYDHAAVGPVDFEEYGHLCALLILQGRLVNECLVLTVRILVIDEDVTHGAWEGEGRFLSVSKGEGHYFWEALGEEGPDTIGVEL